MSAHARIRRPAHALRGQAASEYVIIVSLVAIASLTAVSAFGGQIARTFRRATHGLATGAPAASTSESADLQRLQEQLARQQAALDTQANMVRLIQETEGGIIQQIGR